MRQKRYFVAGVTCHACNAQDTIFVVREESCITQTCVDCGYTQTISSDDASKSKDREDIIQVLNK